MRKYIFISLAVLTILGTLINNYADQPKLAQTGFQFLSIPTDARAVAMGDAFTAVGGNSMSIFYNPANISFMTSSLDLSLSQNQWIANINHYSGSFAFRPQQGRYGVIAFSYLQVDYGDFLGTEVDPVAEKGYRDTGKFSPTAYAVGTSYSYKVTDRFGFGLHFKYVSQDLTGNGISRIPDPDDPTQSITKKYAEGVLAFDFGTIYKTGFKSLAFGMCVQNFSREVQFESEGFQLPLVFNMGISMDMMELLSPDSKVHSFLLAVDANHPRAAPEQLKVGGEYSFMDIIALRVGYHSNVDERSVSFGLGLRKDFGQKGGRIALDYAYTPYGIWDNVQRFSFGLSL